MSTTLFNKNHITILISFTLGFSCHLFFFADKPATDKKLNEYHTFTDLHTRLDAEEKTQDNADEKAIAPKEALTFESIAIELLANIDDAINRAKLTLLISQWAEQAPYEVLSFLLEHNEHKFIMLVLEIAGQQQDPKSFNWLQRHDDEKQFAYWLEQYFTFYAQVAPIEALALVNQIKKNNLQKQLVVVIITQWLSQEPEAVFTWLEQQPKSAFIDELLFNSLNSYITLSPWRAADKITELPRNSRQQQLIMNLVDHISKNNVYDALDWLAELPEQQEREALGSVLSNWANAGRANEVLDYLLNREDIAFNSPSYQAALINIANNSPDILIARINEFPEINQKGIISVVAVSYTNQTPDTPYQWLENISDKSLYDLAVNATIDASYHINPQEAFRRAQEIYLEADKIQYLEKIALAWSDLDKTQAVNAVQSSSHLNDVQKENLLNRMNNKWVH